MLGSLLASLLVSIAPPPEPEDGAPQQERFSHAPAPAPQTHTLRTARFRLEYTERAKGAAEFLAEDIERIRDDVRDVLGRDWPGVTEVRGKGLLLGATLDRPAAAVVDSCRDRGLLVLSAGPDVLRLTPPLVLGPAEVEEALGVISSVLATG